MEETQIDIAKTENEYHKTYERDTGSYETIPDDRIIHYTVFVKDLTPNPDKTKCIIAKIRCPHLPEYEYGARYPAETPFDMEFGIVGNIQQSHLHTTNFMGSYIE